MDAHHHRVFLRRIEVHRLDEPALDIGAVGALPPVLLRSLRHEEGIVELLVGEGDLLDVLPGLVAAEDLERVRHRPVAIDEEGVLRPRRDVDMIAAPRRLAADDRLHRAPLRRHDAEVHVAAILDLEIEALSVRRPEEIADAPVEIGREAPRLAARERHDHELVAVRLVAGTPRRAIREVFSVGREARMRIGGRVRRDLLHLAPRERHAPDLLVVGDGLIDVLLAREIERRAVGGYFIIPPGGSEPVGERVELRAPA